MIRHAKALEREEWQKQSKNDDDRPLSVEGIEEFTRVVAALPALVPTLDSIYTSPLKRTLQTANLVQKSYSQLKVMPTNVLLQGTPWKEVQGFLSKQEWGKDQVNAIVGHENHFSNILGNLIKCTNEEAIRFKKGGIALIDLGQMEGVVTGKLIWFMPPKVILKLGK